MQFLGVLLAASLSAGARDVPYVPQTGALCGGAAAAMIVRYWGGPALRPEDFAAQLNPQKTGIRARDLAAAIAARGFATEVVSGDQTAAQEWLAAGRPFIALVKLDRTGPTFHYVVVLDWSHGEVIVHDPALRPSRVISQDVFLTAWNATERLTITAAPDAAETAALAPSTAPAPVNAETPRTATPCAPLVARAGELARADDLDSAAAELDAAIARCPADPAPRRERAGVYFRVKEWQLAARFARAAVALDPQDQAAIRLAATSLYLNGQQELALRYWNQLRPGEPRLDLVNVSGLSRLAYRSVEDGLGLETGELLTERGYRRAARRIADLPGVLTASLRYEPHAGVAQVEASVVERPVLQPLRWLAVDTALDALVRREVGVTVANLTASGERFDARYRFEDQRPAVFLNGRAPTRLGTAGVSGLWDEQSYAVADGFVRERRKGAAVSLRSWLDSDLRATLLLGADRWNESDSTVLAAATLERRFAADRFAALARLESYLGTSGGPSFHRTSLEFRARTSRRPHNWNASASAAFDAASGDAPRALWPGAGTGRGRERLLRAHPLLRDGLIAGPAFGRRLVHGTIEAEHTIGRAGPVVLGAAVFADLARVRSDSGTASFVDWGAGARIRFPATRSAFRVDLATAGTSGRFVVSAGWVETWR